MKKQKRQLFVLLAILLIAVGSYFLLKLYNDKQSEKSEESTDISVLSVSTDDITSFSYDYEGNIYSFAKEDGSWIYEGDKILDLDETQVNSMLANIANTTSETVITDVSDFEQYGLSSPARTVTIETAEQEYTMYFGDYNNIICKYYIQLEGDNRVYTTSGYRYTSFDVLPKDLVVVEETETEE